MPKYSICITHYNCGTTLEKSLESVLNQINDEFEVVIVDNKSNDGSEKILKKYEEERKITLIQRKCSRGIGRQTALENASGKYIISGLDMDDTFRPSLIPLLRFYHDRVEGKLLSGFGEATMVAPRELLTSLRGWHDLQFRENWELCRRAAGTDQYRWTIFPLVASVNPHPERHSLRSVIKYRYIRYRENLRVGHRQFGETEKTGVSQKIVWFAARFSVMFLEKYRVDYPFTAVDPRYFVDSRGYWAENADLEKERSLYRIGLKRELGDGFSI
ncbi:MAG: glycosyltransferase family 2 protein [Nitrososphaerales archaeon]|jgi:glycosyltransferase involved in cell wall biosynthesis